MSRVESIKKDPVVLAYGMHVTHNVKQMYGHTVLCGTCTSAPQSPC